MSELKITVDKVLGQCTADPPMKPGDYFTVREGDIQIPEGGFICLWALQSLLLVITPEEREIMEDKNDGWRWRARDVQCADPEGRVIFKIERLKKAEIDREIDEEAREIEGTETVESRTGELWNIRVVVEEVTGTCGSGMKPGDHFILRSGRLYIPSSRHFCLYALHATLPLLPAKQRPLEDGDWLKRDNHVICPDPSGNVIMRIERMGEVAR